MTKTTDIDFEDIQGLVRFGHGQLSASAFLLLKIADLEAARRWLNSAAITSATESTPAPQSALQVAFTAPGLRALGLAEDLVEQLSEEFVSGLGGDTNRSRRLGDTGSNAPQHWRWGGSAETTPHLLLMVYADPTRLDSLLASIRDPQFEQAFTQLAELVSRHNGPREPFGFVDGISQPLIDWQQQVSTDLHQRDRYSNRLALGEVLLGYRNEYGLYTERPLLNPLDVDRDDALPDAEDQPQLLDLGRNGTYLVLRQLAQDVRGFWQFVDDQAGADPQQREQIAAAMVGRQRDGTPLIAATGETIDGSEPSDQRNHFTYARDPHGHGCPIGAHVRRANPRSGDFPVGVDNWLSRPVRTLGFGRRHHGDDLVASSRFHRLLRRGRIYGVELTPEQALQAAADDSEERGLHFICLGANISRQFEFVQNAWCASSKFAGLPSESDPLLGNREPLLNAAPTDHFSIPRAGAPAHCIQGLPQFVRVVGGAYFFMPGIKALRFITR